jgi:hypothetical protein
MLILLIVFLHSQPIPAVIRSLVPYLNYLGKDLVAWLVRIMPVLSPLRLGVVIHVCTIVK